MESSAVERSHISMTANYLDIGYGECSTLAGVSAQKASELIDDTRSFRGYHPESLISLLPFTEECVVRDDYTVRRLSLPAWRQPSCTAPSWDHDLDGSKTQCSSDYVIIPGMGVVFDEVKLAVICPHAGVDRQTPSLVAIVNNNFALPLATFLNRSDPQCSGVQFESEVSEDDSDTGSTDMLAENRLVFTPNDGRADQVKAVYSLLRFNTQPDDPMNDGEAVIDNLREIVVSTIAKHQGLIEQYTPATLADYVWQYWQHVDKLVKGAGKRSQAKALQFASKLLIVDERGEDVMMPYLVSELDEVKDEPNFLFSHHKGNYAELRRSTLDDREFRLVLARQIMGRTALKLATQEFDNSVVKIPEKDESTEIDVLLLVRGGMAMKLATLGRDMGQTEDVIGVDSCQSAVTLQELVSQETSIIRHIYLSKGRLHMDVKQFKKDEHHSGQDTDVMSSVKQQRLFRTSQNGVVTGAVQRYEGWEESIELEDPLLRTLNESRAGDRLNEALGSAQSASESAVKALLSSGGSGIYEGEAEVKGHRNSMIKVKYRVSILQGKNTADYNVMIFAKPESFTSYQPIPMFSKVIFVNQFNDLNQDELAEVADIVSTICKPHNRLSKKLMRNIH